MKKSTKSSTKADTFVDTSGFYALLVQGDTAHLRAKDLLARAAGAGARFVTTAYVLDETATLLKARRLTHLAIALFEKVLPSAACRIEWMDPDRFEQTRRFFLKHSDQDWSLTDCASFCLMRKLGLHDAITTDVHFRHAGFRPLLI